MDQLPRLGKRELIYLLLFTCNYVVSVWRGFIFLWVLGMGYVILLWHFLSLPYNYFKCLSISKAVQTKMAKMANSSSSYIVVNGINNTTRSISIFDKVDIFICTGKISYKSELFGLPDL